MSAPWKSICAGCRHINAQEPNQHCYMFKDAPDSKCMQNTEVMDKAKSQGKTVRADQLCEIVDAQMRQL